MAERVDSVSSPSSRSASRLPLLDTGSLRALPVVPRHSKRPRGSRQPQFRLVGKSRRQSIGCVDSLFLPLSHPLLNCDPPAFPPRSKPATRPPPATFSIGWPVAIPIDLVYCFPFFPSFRRPVPIATFPLSRPVRNPPRGLRQPQFRLAGRSRSKSIWYINSPFFPSLALPS